MKKKHSPRLGSVSTVFAQSAVKNNRTAVTTSINIGFILLGLGLLGAGGYAFYTLYWKNRHRRLKHSEQHAASNVSPSAAKAKADSIYAATKGIGTNVKEVYKALTGVNYNGLIDIYNAFGKREPGGLNFSLGNGSDEDLWGFLKGDLNENELKNLRNLLAPDARSLL